MHILLCLVDLKAGPVALASTLDRRMHCRKCHWAIERAVQLADHIPTRSCSSSQPSSSASKPPASLFGSLSTSQAQSSQPPQASSLFGNLPQPQQSGGLFGSSTLAASNQQKLPSSNTFSENQSGQATGSGLFGQTTNQQQSVGGMFGSNTAQQVLPQQGGGMFASLGQAQAPNPAQQPPASLFGGFSNQNKTASLLYVTFSKIVASTWLTSRLQTDIWAAETRKISPRANRLQ